MIDFLNFKIFQAWDGSWFTIASAFMTVAFILLIKVNIKATKDFLNSQQDKRDNNE